MENVRLNFHEEIRRNKFRTVLIFFFFFCLVFALGSVLGLYLGNVYFGLIVAFFAGLVYSLIMYSQGASTILSITGARPVTKQEYPYLIHTVEGLSLAAGLPRPPQAYVIDDTALNAFATGISPEKSYIVFTTGLLNKLNREELEGVIAHEMSHIMNYDIKVMLLAAVLVGVVTLLSDFFLRSVLWGGHRRSDDDKGGSNVVFLIIGLVLAILSPLIAQMIQLAISRKREYLADASGAKLTRYPKGLANALRKISADPDPLVDNANKATAHLFISTPFRGKGPFVQTFISLNRIIASWTCKNRLKALTT